MIERLVAIMARLRDPVSGCEWDRAQTSASIAPYAIEEAHEVVDAIARDDAEEMRDELGDLLLQVVFHARINEEAGRFALLDVVASIADKMERRHPHIFGDAAASPGWEAIKAGERRSKADSSALAGVALALPALMRAEKLQDRAARVGFDWPDSRGPRAKIDEEIAEVEAAAPQDRAEEIGDLLFAVVNWARHLDIDPEVALRAANAKFERRFRSMETMAGPLEGQSLDAMEALWIAAKAQEPKPIA